MARYWFGDSNDWSLAAGGDGTLKLRASTKKYYDAEHDGTQYTDLLIGGVTAASEVATDGLPVRFQGPDGVTEMWESANNGPRVLVTTTDQDENVAELAAQVAQHAADVLEVEATTSGVVAAAIATPGAAQDALNAAYAPQPGAGVVGKNVQFEGVKTISDDGSNVGFVKNTGTGDKATRVYIMPAGDVTTGPGGVMKIFADPFWRDPTHNEAYRDFGLYFAADQNGDTGSQGSGVFYLNSKQGGTIGTWAGKNPDIAVTFQDGAQYAARFVYLPSSVYGGATRAIMILGPAASRSAAAAVKAVLEAQGDIAFDDLTTTAQGSQAGRAIRWWGASSMNNLIQFNQLDLTMKVAGKQPLKLKPAGGIVLGDTTAEIATTATTGHVELPTVNGTPTGNFTAETGHAGIVLDRSSKTLFAKIPGNSSWDAVRTTVVGTSPKVTNFPSSGTWTPDPLATRVIMRCIGGGGGGANGVVAGSGVAATGGPGGGGGGRTEIEHASADVGTSPVAITVGAGGAAGSNGTSTTVSTFARASGGVAPGSATAGGAAGSGGQLGAVGASSSASGATGTNGTASQMAGAGGASGGGITTGNVGSAGGNGGLVSAAMSATGSTAGTVGSGSGGGNAGATTVTAPAATAVGGPGGGGGGSDPAGNGGNGAAGAGFGGGGGGGGAARTGFTAGAGGAGAPGYVQIVEIY
jgi:hypothetical protein